MKMSKTHMGWLAVAVASAVAISGCEMPEEDNGTGAPGNGAQTQKHKAGGKRRSARTSRPAEKTEPEMTSGQANALRSAENYLGFAGFSKKGLIQQLSSPAGDGYSKADATWAANNVDVNWNEEAVESARNYLDMSSFSRQGLIEQLTSSAGDGYTREQAEYAVDQVY